MIPAKANAMVWVGLSLRLNLCAFFFEIDTLHLPFHQAVISHFPKYTLYYNNCMLFASILSNRTNLPSAACVSIDKKAGGSYEKIRPML